MSHEYEWILTIARSPSVMIAQELGGGAFLFCRLSNGCVSWRDDMLLDDHQAQRQIDKATIHYVTITPQTFAKVEIFAALLGQLSTRVSCEN